MRTFWLFLLVLAMGGPAAAQIAFPEGMAPYGGRFAIIGQYVPLYLSADTTVIARRASQGERVAVQLTGNNWTQVRVKGQLYFVRRRYLNLPGALAAVPDSVAVPRDPVSGLIRFVGEVDAPSSQAELMSRAKVWFATAFRGTEVLQVQDAAAGALVGKSFSEIFIHAPEPNNHRLDYTIQLNCRDGHYRYVISQFAFGAFVMNEATGSPAELLVFQTKINGAQRALVLKYKAELYRVARDLQSQVRAAMSKTVGS